MGMMVVLIVVLFVISRLEKRDKCKDDSKDVK